MILDQNWVQISTTGALVQRHQFKPVSLAYATTTPTTEDTFSLMKNDAQIYPAVSGKNLYAKSNSGCIITVEVI